MTEIRFILLRLLADVVFVILIFFAFMCGVHYGTRLIGLYFWFVKLLLGLVGAGLGIRCIDWAKKSILFMLKNGSIYAQCRDDCDTVMGAFEGVAVHFKETISVTVLNKLIRDSLDEVQDAVLAENQEAPLIEILNRFGETKIAKFSKVFIVKAFDYVDECILGYCYSHVSEEHGIIECAVRGFVLFVKNSPKIFGKVISTISLQIVIRIFYWAGVIIFTWNHVYHGMNLSVTLLNLTLVYFISKVIIFTLEDAVLEPLLMYGVIKSFCDTEWSDEDSSLKDELIGKVASFAKLSKYKKKKNGDTDSEEAEENSTEGNDNTSGNQGEVSEPVSADSVLNDIEQSSNS